MKTFLALFAVFTSLNVLASGKGSKVPGSQRTSRAIIDRNKFHSIDMCNKKIINTIMSFISMIRSSEYRLDVRYVIKQVDDGLPMEIEIWDVDGKRCLNCFAHDNSRLAFAEFEATNIKSTEPFDLDVVFLDNEKTYGAYRIPIHFDKANKFVQNKIEVIRLTEYNGHKFNEPVTQKSIHNIDDITRDFNRQTSDKKLHEDVYSIFRQVKDYSGFKKASDINEKIFLSGKELSIVIENSDNVLIRITTKYGLDYKGVVAMKFTTSDLQKIRSGKGIQKKINKGLVNNKKTISSEIKNLSFVSIK